MLQIRDHARIGQGMAIREHKRDEEWDAKRSHLCLQHSSKNRKETLPGMVSASCWVFLPTPPCNNGMMNWRLVLADPLPVCLDSRVARSVDMAGMKTPSTNISYPWRRFLKVLWIWTSIANYGSRTFIPLTPDRHRTRGPRLKRRYNPLPTKNGLQ